jgi:hypothetical protein
METKEIIFLLLVSLLSTIPFLLSNYFLSNYFLIVIIECISVFIGFLIVLRKSKQSFNLVINIFSIFYLFSRIGLMNIYSNVNFIYFIYNFLLGIFWINIMVKGVKTKDKLLWALWFIVGLFINIVSFLLYSVY